MELYPRDDADLEFRKAGLEIKESDGLMCKSKNRIKMMCVSSECPRLSLICDKSGCPSCLIEEHETCQKV